MTVRHFPAEKLIGLIIEHCPRLHRGYYRIYSICNPFPSKHPKTQIPKYIWPQGSEWWMVDMHLLFPWDSCNHSYCSLQPKDTENGCLPITEWLFISRWKKDSIYCWEPSNKISFPLFFTQLIFQTFTSSRSRFLQTVLKQKNPVLKARPVSICRASATPS